MSMVEIAVVWLIVAVFVVVAVSVSYDRPRPADLPTVAVRVAANETLWDIAERHPIAGTSTRETVAVIRELNGLDSALVQAGAVLEVPADSTTFRRASAQ